MPLYLYQCKTCQREFEQVRETNHRHKGRCPTCGGKGKKLITASLVGGFKGRKMDLFDANAKRMDNVEVTSKGQLSPFEATLR